MAELNKWVPSDMLEPIKRFLDGDLTMTPSIKVEQFVDGTTLVVRAEVPGIDPDKDVDVSVSEGMLHIRAEREEKTEHKSKDGYRSEFRYGSFSRSVALPPGAREEDITATYKDGVLEVRAPAPVTAPDDDGQEDQDRPPVARDAAGRADHIGPPACCAAGMYGAGLSPPPHGPPAASRRPRRRAPVRYAAPGDASTPRATGSRSP